MGAMSAEDETALEGLVDRYGFEALAHTLARIADRKAETSTLQEAALAFTYRVTSNRFSRIARSTPPTPGIDY